MQGTARWYIVVGGSVVVLAAALALVASFATGASDELAGSEWRLTMLNSHAPRSTPEPITLGFQPENRAGGNSGCNLYGGSYAIAGSNLTITDVNSTMRACADQALNEQEAEYYRALRSVVAYQIVNDQLTLKDTSDSPVLIFTRA